MNNKQSIHIFSSLFTAFCCDCSSSFQLIYFDNCCVCVCERKRVGKIEREWERMEEMMTNTFQSNYNQIWWKTAADAMLKIYSNKNYSPMCGFLFVQKLSIDQFYPLFQAITMCNIMFLNRTITLLKNKTQGSHWSVSHSKLFRFR